MGGLSVLAGMGREMMKRGAKPGYREMARFIAAGAMAAGIHYGVYVLLSYLLPPALAYAGGYFISFLFNFYVSCYFTFKTCATWRKSVRFLLCHIINFLIQLGLFHVFLAMSIPELLLPLPVLMIAVPVNFLLVRLALR